MVRSRLNFSSGTPKSPRYFTTVDSSSSPWSNEAEIPAIICQTFTALGLKKFQIRVNNRKP